MISLDTSLSTDIIYITRNAFIVWTYKSEVSGKLRYVQLLKVAENIGENSWCLAQYYKLSV